MSNLIEIPAYDEWREDSDEESDDPKEAEGEGSEDEDRDSSDEEQKDESGPKIYKNKKHRGDKKYGTILNILLYSFS